ncbi:SDR family oxidoreductase [Amycolatopsis sp. NPDC059021]|uniref:SDR family oxidoreductase n=1 Tax=Amycolatopsis sp. NPDC059021 TaxID=3346704 RepID=UPI00366B087E
MSDRVLLITGASRGLGAATARRAAEAGYRLALLARNRDAVGALARESDGLALSADVSDPDSVSAAVAEVTDRFGRLDAVFANAGQLVQASFFGDGGAEPSQWRDMILTNVYGLAVTARATLPALASSGGHLVITGSVAGRHIRKDGAGLYSATKWAATAIAGSIREEAVGTGVRVTIVQPGLVDTEMISDAQRAKPNLVPDDIARAVLYALDQPPSVDVNEIVVRPTGQVL